MKIKIMKLECKRCGHQWTPRKAEVTICPKCNSAYWNREKKNNHEGVGSGDKRASCMDEHERSLQQPKA